MKIHLFLRLKSLDCEVFIQQNIFLSTMADIPVNKMMSINDTDMFHNNNNRPCFSSASTKP